MKKIFTFFAAAMTALSMSAASYGILVNGKTYFAGTQVDEYEGFQQYLAHVPVKAGDFCQLCDAENKSVWAVDLNTASVEGFTRNGDKYDISVDGCYDFYIKLKYGQDQLYIGRVRIAATVSTSPVVAEAVKSRMTSTIMRWVGSMRQMQVKRPMAPTMITFCL